MKLLIRLTLLSVIALALTGCSEAAPKPGNYFSYISDEIDKAAKYPKEAYAADAHGLVNLKIDFARDGTILSSTIANSSRFASLDNAAIQAIKDVGKFPPVPAETAPEKSQFTVYKSLSF